MSRILLIGNSGLKHHGKDGQTVKVRLYLKKIQDEGFDVSFIDLENFKRRPFFILQKIKKGIKNCDRIVLISAKRGCKFLIPFISKHNKKYKKPFVLPLVGTSVLHFSIDKLSEKQKYDFIVNHNYNICVPNKRIKKELMKIDFILPETDLLTSVFREFYDLENVYTLNNFRDIKRITNNKKTTNDSLNLVFLSRIMKEKGIFDLINIVNELNDSNPVNLDIYGQIVLDKEEVKQFEKSLDNKIKYCGVVDLDNVTQTISNYDLFVFPTRFVGEGTPGVISESLIAGTPVLTSDFPQAKYLLINGQDSLFYKMFDNEDLKRKLLYIIKDRNLLLRLQNNAIQSGKKFTYNYERNKFLKYVCGKKEEL